MSAQNYGESMVGETTALNPEQKQYNSAGYNSQYSNQGQPNPAVQNNQPYNPQYATQGQVNPAAQNNQVYNQQYSNQGQVNPAVPNNQAYNPQYSNQGQANVNMQNNQVYNPQIPNQGQVNVNMQQNQGMVVSNQQFSVYNSNMSNLSYGAQYGPFETVYKETDRLSYNFRMRFSGSLFTTAFPMLSVTVLPNQKNAPINQFSNAHNPQLVIQNPAVTDPEFSQQIESELRTRKQLKESASNNCSQSVSLFLNIIVWASIIVLVIGIIIDHSTMKLVAIIIFATFYTITVIESLCSSSCGYVSNIITMEEFQKYLEKIDATPPNLSWSIRNFHYRRNRDDNNRTKRYTHSAVSYFAYKLWNNFPLNSFNIDELSNYPICRVNTEKFVSFKNKHTRDSYFYYKNWFIFSNLRDVHYDFSVQETIKGIKKHQIVETVPGSKPCWLNCQCYTIFSLLAMGTCYRHKMLKDFHKITYIAAKEISI